MGFWQWLFKQEEEEAPRSGRAVFARRLLRGLREAGDVRSFRFDEEKFSLVEEGVPQPNVLYLHNIHAEYEAAPSGVREAVLQRFVRSMLPYALPETWSEAAPLVRARVTDRGGFEQVALRARLSGMDFPSTPYIPLAEHLALALVIDLPDAIISVSWDECARWKVSRSQALEVAVENLARLSREDFERQGALFVSPWRDNYDASRLVLIESIAELPVKGRTVALLPHRDHLLITGSEDVEGLTRLADEGEALASAPRFLGFFPVVLEEGTWRVFRLDEAHPLYARYRTIEVQQQVRLHAEQKELLDALYERTGEDVHVATFQGIHSEGRTFSYATWTKEVHTLLPRTDVVVLVDLDAPEAEPLKVQWDALERHAGHLLVPEGTLYPARYRVKDFPSEEVLAMLRGE
jgi:hypothetical protein